jgi:CubicO group peptidase (beta-lactamase class C family)
LFCCSSSKAQTGYDVPNLVNFDDAMINLLSDYDVPGGQLAITYHGRLVYSRGFGYADIEANTMVCPNNIFRLASLSKQITSITLMHLYEQGRVGLNDTIFGADGLLNSISFQSAIDPRVYNITVRNLLQHAGGWDRDVSGDPMFDSYYIAQAMAVAAPANEITTMEYVLNNQMLDFTPGTQSHYSNLGYSILGRVIEEITGQEYETYVRDSILAPLDISDMYCGKNLLVDKLPNEVNYYDYSNASYVPSVYNNPLMVPEPYGGFNIEGLDAAGGWVGSAEDLCKILCAVDRFTTVPDMLLPATIDTMISPSFVDQYYALGWNVSPFHNNYWHTGSLPGTTTEIVRANNQLNWAILLNTRPLNTTNLVVDVDQLVWTVLPTLDLIPSLNLFDSTSFCISTSVASINEKDASLEIFPNPSNGIMTVRYSGKLSARASVHIYTSIGDLVYSDKFIPGQSELKIERLSFPSGYYVVKVQDDSNLIVQKIIIQ